MISRNPGSATDTPSSSGSRAARRCCVIRMRLASDEDAARLFEGYSEVLEKKDTDRTGIHAPPQFLLV